MFGVWKSAVTMVNLGYRRMLEWTSFASLWCILEVIYTDLHASALDVYYGVGAKAL